MDYKIFENPTELLRDYQKKSIVDLKKAYRSFYSEHARAGNHILVLPTAAGKTFIIASMIAEALSHKNEKRVLVVTHSKELVSQNYDQFIENFDGADEVTGIYCAGLGRRDYDKQVVFGMINSIGNKALIDNFDILIIDECHRVDNIDTKLKSNYKPSRYRTLIKRLEQSNKKLSTIGLTATPCRFERGMNVGIFGSKRAFFDTIAHETFVDSLLLGGYITPLVTPDELEESLIMKFSKSKTKDDLTKKQLKEAVDSVPLVKQLEVVKEEISKGRGGVLIFCSTVEHANDTSNILSGFKISNSVVVGDTASCERAGSISNFKTMKIKVLINVDVLTVGFSARDVDLLVFLRPRKSVSLYVQMMGRGMRLYDKNIFKRDNKCMVLDFAGNISRHGPINQINYHDLIDNGTVCPDCGNTCLSNISKCGFCGHIFKEIDFSTEKKCSHCDAINPVSARKCTSCDTPFVESGEREKVTPSHQSIISAIPDEIRDNSDKLFIGNIEKAVNLHTAKNGNKSIKVSFARHGDLIAYSFLSCASSFPAKKSKAFLNALGCNADSVPNAFKALSEIEKTAQSARSPNEIVVRKKGRWNNVVEINGCVI